MLKGERGPLNTRPSVLQIVEFAARQPWVFMHVLGLNAVSCVVCVPNRNG